MAAEQCLNLERNSCAQHTSIRGVWPVSLRDGDSDFLSVSDLDFNTGRDAPVGQYHFAP
jgi:hypothetical protein